MTVSVRYSCAMCGIHDQSVEVEARTDQSKDALMKWMDELKWSIAKDHSRTSPSCEAATISEVKIPISGANMIGGEAVQ